jgi:hypothetical protein
MATVGCSDLVQFPIVFSFFFWLRAQLNLLNDNLKGILEINFAVK